MARPAFRPTYWQNYPPPFYPGASGQYPVPGWGVRPVMAGPARVGVGQDDLDATEQPVEYVQIDIEPMVAARALTIAVVSVGAVAFVVSYAVGRAVR